MRWLCIHFPLLTSGGKLMDFNKINRFISEHKIGDEFQFDGVTYCIRDSFDLEKDGDYTFEAINKSDFSKRILKVSSVVKNMYNESPIEVKHVRGRKVLFRSEVNKNLVDAKALADERLNSRREAQENSDEFTHISREELFSIMDSKACNNFVSKSFWHFTTYQRFLDILESGYFFSRNYLESNGIAISHDNKVYNDLSKSILGSNKSKLTTHYARFYLRNDSSCIQRFEHFEQDNNPDFKKFMILIEIDRNALFESEEETFLTYFNAHYLYDSFYWNPPFNKYEDVRLNNLLYDFSKIYGPYNPDFKWEQNAEFLVKEKLPIKFIKRINVYDKTAKFILIKKLNEMKFYDIISKIEVNKKKFCIHD